MLDTGLDWSSPRRNYFRTTCNKVDSTAVRISRYGKRKKVEERRLPLKEQQTGDVNMMKNEMIRRAALPFSVRSTLSSGRVERDNDGEEFRVMIYSSTVKTRGFWQHRSLSMSDLFFNSQ